MNTKRLAAAIFKLHELGKSASEIAEELAVPLDQARDVLAVLRRTAAPDRAEKPAPKRAARAQAERARTMMASAPMRERTINGGQAGPSFRQRLAARGLVPGEGARAPHRVGRRL